MSEQQNRVPAEAVEAAAKYLAEKFYWNGELLPETAREILEAAAPYIAAVAWEEGVSYALPGTSDGVKAFNEMRTANPYGR